MIIHILKKDFRRFGFEIGLAMLLLVLYTWSEPRMWSSGSLFYAVQITASLITEYGSGLWGFLLIMGWIIILIRLFQEESPAGDRQFWITRPYRWPSLLAAKVLFVLAVVNVPLLIAQMILLRVAGFSPWHYLPGVLQLHLRLLGIALILIALTVISAGFKQVTWALLLFLLYLGAALWVGSGLPESDAWHGSSVWDTLTWCVLVGVPILVIVRQYWLRRTASARLWLLGGLLAVIVLTAATPYHWLIDHEYPPGSAGEQPLFQFQLDQELPSSRLRQLPTGEMNAGLNFNIGKLAPGYLVEFESLEITLQAPDGARWSSGWKPIYELLSRERLETSDPRQTMWVGLGSNSEIWLEPKMFARLKDRPLKVHVAAATSVFHDVEGTVIEQTQSEFAAPATGICVLQPGFVISLLTCRAPLHMPRLVGVTTRVFRSCPPSPADLVASPRTTTGWLTANFDPGTVLTPIATFIPNLRVGIQNDVAMGPCSGIPITFRQPEFLRRQRVEAEFEGFKLAGGTAGTLEEKK